MAIGYELIEETIADTYHCINVVLVGERGCGKKTLIKSFTQQTPCDTFGSVVIHRVKYEKWDVEFHIWSICGVLSEGNKCKDVYARADVAVICFSVEDSGALDFIRQSLLPEVSFYCPQKAPRVLIRNKKDLYKDNEEMISRADTCRLVLKMGTYDNTFLDISGHSPNAAKKVFEVITNAYLKSLKTQKECSIQ